MIYEKVLKTIKQNSLIAPKSKVIVAISGGADSVCLLDVLFHLKDELYIEVEAAHLNHNLRGEESDGDENYVRDLCRRLGIKLHVKSVDIMALAKGKSLEDVARGARYDFFNSLSSNQKAYIATAHTVNDNAETFFINLIRGSGSRGLCGIPIKRDNIIRPLIDVTRAEITEHLKSAGLTYRTDSTNSDTDYLRNYIRHEIIPVFEKRKDINLFKSISRATENLQNENAFLEDFAIKNDTDNAKELLELNDAILYRVLTRKLEKEYGIILDSNHFEAIKKLLEKGSSKELIKENVFAVCEKGKFQFRKLDIKDDVIYPLTEGENLIADKKILIKRIKEIYKGLTKFTIDCDKINGNLFARTKRDGDVFYCINRKVTTKLAKLLKNDGIPNLERDTLLVICDESENVVFVEGYGADKRFAADKNSQNIINIEII